MNDPNLTKAVGKVPRNGLERWARRGLISNEPPFTRWDRLILLLVLILVLLVTLGAGLLSDIGSLRIGPAYHPVVSSWQLGQLAFITVALLYGWAIFGVRAMHPLSRLGMLFVLAFLLYLISDLTMTHAHLTVAWLAFCVGVSCWPVRTAARPNEYELAERYRQQQKEQHED